MYSTTPTLRCRCTVAGQLHESTVVQDQATLKNVYISIYKAECMYVCMSVRNARPHFLTWEAGILNRTSLGPGAGHCEGFKFRRGHRRSLEAVLEVVSDL